VTDTGGPGSLEAESHIRLLEGNLHALQKTSPRRFSLQGCARNRGILHRGARVEILARDGRGSGAFDRALYSPHIHIFLEMEDGSSIGFFEVPKDPGNMKDLTSPDWIQHFAFEVEPSRS
jgi:hypothetical protein